MPIIHKGICEYCGKTYRGRGKRFCSLQCRDDWQRQKFALLEVDTRKYPIFTHYPRLKGDWMISGDWHTPYLLVEFVKKLITVAKKYLMKKLIIGGDFLNQGVFSSWGDIFKQASFKDELMTARRIFILLLSQFEEILLLTAGHERRLLRQLDFKVGAEEAYSMFTDKIGEGIKVSPYSHCLINNKWKVIHPRGKGGRKKKLSLTSEMATKYHKNIICLHQHYTALGLDISGKYVVCDLGMMADSRKLGYTQMDADVWPTSSNSFAMVKNNRITLFTEHPDLIDWAEVLKQDALPKK